jgi:hypothetical protein
MSLESALQDEQLEKEFQERQRARELRRGQVSFESEAREMVKRASQKAVAPEKSDVQIAYEQEQARQASIAADLLMEQQLKRIQEYGHTHPASETKQKIKEDLKIDEQPNTQTLEAFSLGRFNPNTKLFSDIVFHSLQIEEHPQLQVKNSHIKHPGEGKVLIAAAKKRSGDQGVKQINIMNGMNKFGGGTAKEKIILPIRLARKELKGKTMSGSAVNDLLLKGYKEIDRSSPEILAILSAHDKDQRLCHSITEVQKSSAINSAKLGKEEAREIQEFKVPSKGCNVPQCSICFSESEVGTIPDYTAQQSVFL